MKTKPETIEIARSLARTWMPGTRFGSDREAWRHPEDVFNLLTSLPGLNPEELKFVQAVGWLHDIIEDGVYGKERITAAILDQHEIPAHIQMAVVQLSKTKGMTLQFYVGMVLGAPELVQVVKCADRVCNLREAWNTFPEPRWQRYVAETKEWILPMAEEIEEPYGVFLASELRRLAVEKRV